MLSLDAIYDVAVFGGGFCGLGAAFEAAKAGRSVLLVEPRPAPGWEATWAANLTLEASPSPFVKRLRGELAKRGGIRGDRIDAAITELVLDRLCDEAGIEWLLYSTPVAVQVEHYRATAVIIANKSGEQVVKAAVFVDATENGRLWRLTGARFEDPPAIPGRFTVFFNNVPAGCPVGRGIRETVWDGEMAFEYDVPRCDAALARRCLPEQLRAIRGQLPALSGAIVSHTAVEPFPLATPRAGKQSRGHPLIDNLMGAGLWAVAGSNTLAGRVEAGEKAGAAAVGRRLVARDYRASRQALLSQAAPPVHEADVVVAGGGTGGAIAAMTAARRGAKTVLIEASPFLGGIGAGGGIHVYYQGLAGGAQDEVDALTAELAPLFTGAGQVVGFHPDARKVALQLLAERAGVEIVFNNTVSGVETSSLPGLLSADGDGPAGALPRRARGVFTAGPDGTALYRGEVIIDATGDGDVAARAGAPCTTGRESDGLMHAYSQAAGRLDAQGRMVVVNFDAGYVDPTDVTDLTRARREGLRHYWRERFTPQDRLTCIAPLIGLRNSRQIVGEYRVTLMDQIAGRRFPDCVGYARGHYDNHATDYENESDEAMLWVWLMGNWEKPIGCEIPYRALLPLRVEGLLMACRALSLTHDAHNQFRMQRDVQRVGEVAGIAAALAVKHHVPPRQVDVKELQAELVKTGAIAPPGRPSPLEADLKTTALADKAGPDMVARLDAEQPSEALAALMMAGQGAVGMLRESVKSDRPLARFWSAVALAMLGDASGVPELAAAVRERRPTVPKGQKTVPLWMPAAVLLGRARDPRATPVLVEVLRDASAPLDGLIAAVRALGRIGDTSAVPALLKFLQRSDLPVKRPLQTSAGMAGEVVEDARWQLELAAVESLARLGSPQPLLAQRWLRDPRACVRRYAQRVAAMRA